MSEESPVSTPQEAQLTRQLGDTEHHIAQLEDQVRTLEGERSAAEGTDKDAIQSQLAAVQRDRLNLLQRVNTLRAQLELPAVTPEAVLPRRRGAHVYPALVVPEPPAKSDA